MKSDISFNISINQSANFVIYNNSINNSNSDSDSNSNSNIDNKSDSNNNNNGDNEDNGIKKIYI